MDSFLKRNGVPRDRHDRAVLCCEELLLNVSQHGVSGSPDRTIDVIARAGEEPSILIRDDGGMFNPIEYTDDGMGLHIAKAFAKT